MATKTKSAARKPVPRTAPPRSAPRAATRIVDTAPRSISVKRTAPRRRESKALEFARKWGSSIFVLALLALVVHDLFGSHGLLAMLRSRNDLQRLRQEISQINDDNRRLTEEIHSLRSDPRLIERIARDEMGLSRPGELIFKMPPKK
jgi:cell division protein FtsB